MSRRYLIDTNILIYPHDAADPAKSARALAVLSHVNEAESAALPAQVLAEFASVALKKLKPQLDPDVVFAQIGRLMRMFPVLPLTPAIVFIDPFAPAFVVEDLG